MAERLIPGQFYGNVAGRRKCGGVLLSELVHSRERVLPAHAHGHPYVCMLAGGGYQENWGRTEIWYDPFTTVFHPEEFQHADRIGPGGARFFCIEIPREDFEVNGLAAPKEVLRDLKQGRLSRAAVRLFAAHRLGEEVEIPLAEFLGKTAGRVGARELARPKWLDRIVEMLHERCAEALTLNEMAAAAGVHPVHLSRTFEKYEGCAVSERLRLLRLQKAMRSLAEGRSGLAEIAVDCGFTDQSHLSRVFRKVFGITPGRFRAACGDSRLSD